MSKKTIVCTHSPTLAFLLYETNCAVNNQLGLLLGNVQDERIKSTTDENDANEEETTKIYIEHCIPFPQIIQFGSLGQFDDKLMAKFCETIRGDVIGWYSFRRNFKWSSPSMKDNLIHQRFLTYFKMNPENFILGLMAANVQLGRSTHGFNYKFLRYTKKSYESLKFKIYCLSDKNNGYINNPTFPVSQDFQRIQNSVSNQSAINTVKEIYKSSIETLSVLNLELQEIETKRNKLENEVRGLRKTLRKNDRFKVNIDPSTVKKEIAHSLLKFDPNQKYFTNGNENPISPDIYEKIKNASEKFDDDVVMNDELENSITSNWDDRRSFAEPSGSYNSLSQCGGTGTLPHTSNIDVFHDKKSHSNKTQCLLNSSGRSREESNPDQKLRPNLSTSVWESTEKKSI